MEGKGLEKASYLFGTIHISCDATLSDKVKKALDETTQVVLEIDMDAPNLQSNLMKSMNMKGDKTLRDFVTDEEYTLIDSLFIKNMGMSVKVVEKIKPFFLSSFFLPNMIDCPIQSFEKELMKVAHQQNEEVKGLEKVAEQMNIFDEIPYKDQVKDLIKSAKDNLAMDKKMIAKIIEAYKNEEILSMLDIMNDKYNTISFKYQDLVLYNRNKNWISKIEAFAKEQPTFIGVGAGHLAGKKGVIVLLRKAGYTVTAVK